MKKSYLIEIGSSPHFDRLFAEIKFIDKDIYVIVSEEIPGEYRVHIYSLNENSRILLSECSSIFEIEIPLLIFNDAISESIRKLKKMDSK